MKCICEIKKVIINLKKEIEDEIKAEQLGGGFDDDWVDDMKAREYILKDLENIVMEHEFWLQQHNQ